MEKKVEYLQPWPFYSISVTVIGIGIYFNQYKEKNHNFWISLPNQSSDMKMSWD